MSCPWSCHDSSCLTLVTLTLPPRPTVFNTATKTWSTLPSQSGVTSRSDFACWTLDTRIFCTGGYSADYSRALNTTIVLNTTDGTSLFRTGLVADRLVQSGDCRAQVLGGQVYVFGGFTTDFCTPLASVEKYDPVANTWSLKAPMFVARGCPADLVINQTLYAIGGEQKDAQCATSVPIGNIGMYNTTANAWSTNPYPLAIPRFRFSAAAYKNKIYDFGGQGPALTVNGVLVYPVLARVYSLDVSLIGPIPSTINAGSAAQPAALLSAAAMLVAAACMW